MAIDVACPTCTFVIPTKPEHAGRRILCPRCKASVTVPMPAAVLGIAIDSDDDPTKLREPDDVSPVAPAPSTAPGGNSRARGWVPGSKRLKTTEELLADAVVLLSNIHAEVVKIRFRFGVLLFVILAPLGIAIVLWILAAVYVATVRPY